MDKPDLKVVGLSSHAGQAGGTSHADTEHPPAPSISCSCSNGCTDKLHHLESRVVELERSVIKVWDALLQSSETSLGLTRNVAALVEVVAERRK